MSQLRSDLKNASGFSLALDESADSSDVEQLIVYVRFDVNDTFKEDLLGVMPLRDTTREDIYHALKQCLIQNDIDLKKLLSVSHHRWCTINGWKKSGTDWSFGGGH